MSKRFFDHLQKNVYCELRPSTVHGVGVFAARPIPAGTDPFQRMDKRKSLKRFDMSAQQLTNLPSATLNTVRRFFIGEQRNDDDEVLTYPICDPNAIDMSFYLNHADGENANVCFGECKVHQNCAYDHLYVTRDIACDEELFLDYHSVGGNTNCKDKQLPPRKRAKT